MHWVPKFLRKRQSKPPWTKNSLYLWEFGTTLFVGLCSQLSCKLQECILMQIDARFTRTATSLKLFLSAELNRTSCIKSNTPTGTPFCIGSNGHTWKHTQHQIRPTTSFCQHDRSTPQTHVGLEFGICCRSLVFFGMTMLGGTGSMIKGFLLIMTHHVQSCESCACGGMSAPFPLNIFTTYFAFGSWFGITVGVLLGMDVMECFLHTLRLHWVVPRWNSSLSHVPSMVMDLVTGQIAGEFSCSCRWIFPTPRNSRASSTRLMDMPSFPSATGISCTKRRMSRSNSLDRERQCVKW